MHLHVKNLQNTKVKRWPANKHTPVHKRDIAWWRQYVQPPNARFVISRGILFCLQRSVVAALRCWTGNSIISERRNLQSRKSSIDWLRKQCTMGTIVWRRDYAVVIKSFWTTFPTENMGTRRKFWIFPSSTGHNFLLLLGRPESAHCCLRCTITAADWRPKQDLKCWVQGCRQTELPGCTAGNGLISVCDRMVSCCCADLLDQTL